MPGRPLATTRRTALGGLLSVAVLAACDADSLRPPDAEPTPSQNPSAGELDPDQALVQDVVGQISRTWGVLAFARTAKQLKPRLGPLQRMHEAHLEALGAATPTFETPTDPGQGGTVAQRYRRALDREERLHRELATAAVDAESGALAKLFASMSAAVAQHLAVLPDRDVGQ